MPSVPPVGVKPISTKGVYQCSSSEDYSFCWPNQKGDFYVFAAPSIDAKKIQALFGNSKNAPTPIAKSFADIIVPKDQTAYNVNSLLPKSVAENIGRKLNRPGPNCHYNSLAAAGINFAVMRNVSDQEFDYYLKRNYELTSCNTPNLFGLLILYDITASSFTAGYHSAFGLPAGTASSKGAPDMDYIFEIAPVDKVMEVADSHWKGDKDDRLAQRKSPWAGKEFKKLCYSKTKTPAIYENQTQGRDLNWFLPLFTYYIARLRKESVLTGEKFREGRVDVLTENNIADLVSSFRCRLGVNDPTQVLLSMDEKVAMSYLEFLSLYDQRDAMIEAFNRIPYEDPRGKQRAFEKLYKEHGVNFNAAFYDELNLYLKVLEVPEEKKKTITDLVVAKIKTYDPMELAKSEGTKRIPYMQIVDEAIKSVIYPR